MSTVTYFPQMFFVNFCYLQKNATNNTLTPVFQTFTLAKIKAKNKKSPYFFVNFLLNP
jgi:hypothetical protein